MDDFPRPPFPEQQQPIPGATDKMDPRPDHGEDSYTSGFGSTARVGTGTSSEAPTSSAAIRAQPLSAFRPGARIGA